MSGYGNSYAPALSTGTGYGYTTGGTAKRPKTGGPSSQQGYGSGAPSYATSYGSSGATGSYDASGASSGYGYGTATGYENYGSYGTDYSSTDYSSYYDNSAYYSTQTAQASLTKTKPPLPKGPPPVTQTLGGDLWGLGQTQNQNSGFKGRRGGGGRGRGGNRSGDPAIGPKRPSVPKPKAPQMTNDQKQRIENHNLKQLVCPKAPHKILSEMMGGKVAFNYADNPPLPPDAQVFDEMHTLNVTIDGETSSGTGPSHDIAKNICSEHSIMGVVTRRYDAINEMVNKGLKSKDELLLEDETPFELASMAVFKMLNEWEAKGFELPYDLEDILYTSHLYLPVKERLGWIRGSNLGFSTTLEPPPGVPKRVRGKRTKNGVTSGPSEEALGSKNPVAFLNEIRGGVEYMELGHKGLGPNIIYSIGVNLDGVPYLGEGPSKKDAKKACACDVLFRLYGINVPM